MLGVLRQRVRLQERTVTHGALGQTVVWRPVQDVHARVIPLSVRAVAEYMQMNTVVSHKVILGGTVSVNLGVHRILHGSKVYEPSQSAKHYDGVTEIVVREI